MKIDAAPGQPELAEVSREQTDGDTIVVFVRHFDAPATTVWAELTDPQELVRWAPHTADRDLSAIGAVVFTMLGDEIDGMPTFEVQGHVLVSDPPYELEHTWATDVLDWQLRPDRDGPGTTLTLRHRLTDAGMASAVAAGWHLCLDVAADAMAGRETVPVRGMAAMQRGWSGLNERYAKALGVEPSRIDL